MLGDWTFRASFVQIDWKSQNWMAISENFHKSWPSYLDPEDLTSIFDGTESAEDGNWVESTGNWVGSTFVGTG